MKHDAPGSDGEGPLSTRLVRYRPGATSGLLRPENHSHAP